MVATKPLPAILPEEAILSPDRLSRLENFGRSITSAAYLHRPSRVEQIYDLFESARARGFTIGLRGAARSYGDASINSGGVVLDLQRLNRILDWDPVQGVIRVEPGVTIRQIWQYTLEDGWWPPVVPGTMAPTIGGCLGMNIHGKNNFAAGPIGEHVLAFTALLPSGEEIRCTPEEESELFYAMIGGLGILGVFTSVTLQLKRVYSGDLWVEAWNPSGLESMLEDIENRKGEADYLVGWIDSTARGASLGRGQIHRADYLAPGEDPQPAVTLGLAHQTLPENIFGLIPKSVIWRLMRPFFNRPGLKAVNTARYLSSRILHNQTRVRQSFAAFNFLLDYVPNWEKAYGSGGLIQFQIFIPREKAHDVFSETLRRTQKNGEPTYLGVLKRHRPDRFLLSHAVDGFSLAMDFRITKNNVKKIQAQADTLTELALEAGGRFYFAKDCTLNSETAERFLGPDTLRRFRALKERCDPGDLLETDLYRRCFPR
ncbi:MAG TPA: FAD-binding oxidoreductase [Anaerolineales bacterium]|nr:FAD-binding oxidoreductase [Anaerolineales bacterium]